MLHQEWCVHLRARLTVLEYAKVVGKDYGFACKHIGIDTGWDRLSLDHTCPTPASYSVSPDSRTMISSSRKWNDVSRQGDKPSAACDYRCPSSRALSVLARQPKREWCLPPAIGNAGSIKPYPSVFVPLLLPRADSADVIFPQYLVQAH
jgi:hypothetical protein